MSIVRFNPLRELLDVEREFNKLFSTFNNRFGVDKTSDVNYDNAVWSPFTDIYEDNDNFKLKVDLPGLNKEDVKITYQDGSLAISGERKQDKETSNSKYHRVERMYGKFYRTFALPQKIKHDNIEAEFANGQLTIVIPKAEEAKPKQLEIKVN